jgi:GDP-D-mannose dehydratase
VVQHIKASLHSESIIPLVVGNLDSYRNILHASDVANAIHVILSQPSGNDYLICNTESNKVYDLVCKLYENAGILLERRYNSLYKKDTDVKIIEITETLNNEMKPTNICGYPEKLLKIGWIPSISINDILVELLYN